MSTYVTVMLILLIAGSIHQLSKKKYDISGDVDRDYRRIFGTTGTNVNSLIEFFAIATLISLVICVINYSIFYTFAGKYAIALLIVSFFSKIHSSIFSLKALRKCLTNRKTFKLWGRFLRIHEPPSVYSIYLDTIVVLYCFLKL